MDWNQANAVIACIRYSDVSRFSTEHLRRLCNAATIVRPNNINPTTLREMRRRLAITQATLAVELASGVGDWAAGQTEIAAIARMSASLD